MSCQKYICTLQNSIESVLITDINLKTPTDQEGQFLPGKSICEKTIRVALVPGVCFPPGVILQLQLVAYVDVLGERIAIEPKICVSKKTLSNESKIWFDFTGEQIELPKGYIYLPNVLENCVTDPISLHSGNATKYFFLLTFKKSRLAPLSCPGIPFIADVLSNATCDIKCEKPQIVSEQDETHTLKIFCKASKTFVYASPVHCVTHCQAPKPLFLFYSENCPNKVVVQGQVCSTCQ